MHGAAARGPFRMQQGPANALGADEFFGFVERFLGPPCSLSGITAPTGQRMTSPRVGAASCRREETARTPRSSGLSTASRRAANRSGDWLALATQRAKTSDGSTDEPSTGRLELGDWRPVAQDLVDWYMWRDDSPCSVAEVERRLPAVGRAVLTFVQERGGFPQRPDIPRTGKPNRS